MNTPDPSMASAKLEFAKLDLWMQSVKPLIDKHKALKSQIEALYDGEAADLPIVESVGPYELHISAKAVEKSWRNMRAVYNAVGSLSRFLRMCSVSFKAAAAELGAEKAAELQIEAQTGTRRIKACAKVEAPAQQAA